MNPEEARELLERLGALQEGHFLLSSGRHSDRYVEKARVLERPDVTMALAREMASWYARVDVVVSPAVAAIPLGFAVAVAAGARSVFAEREEGTMRLRRGFRLIPGDRTLVVEDVVTTGGSAREVHDLAARTGAEVLGVAALVDRSSGAVGFSLRSLLQLEASTWTPQECPRCRQGEPILSPGSRHVSAAPLESFTGPT
ncbi:MAG: orotate phosphoribosyltransferase [Actinobacteria bacterium]|nr:MAG: orotate phosphoribosyltransferase [Actinomycetota bacterium]